MLLFGAASPSPTAIATPATGVGVRKQPRPAVPDQAGGFTLPAGGLNGLRWGERPHINIDDGVL